MTTLNLNKKSKGYYSKTVNNIEISVSKYENTWTGQIVNLEAYEDDFIIYEVFTETKKESIKLLTNFLLTL